MLEEEVGEGFGLAEPFFEGLATLLAHQGIRVLTLGEEEEADLLLAAGLGQAVLQRLPGGFTAGAVAIASGVIVNADVSATAAIAHTKLAPVLPTYVLVGNASSQAVAVAVSGDIALDNAGVAAIATNVIVDADVKTDAAIAATKIAGTAVTYSSAAQSDTNATTDATAYNAAFVGQWLIGSAGPSTNALWVARATGTNDWQQIKP